MTKRLTSLYVHIPFCDGKCGYCAFYSILYDAELADRLLAALEQELILSVQDTGVVLAADTVYIGGGTPSALSAPQLECLSKLLLPFLSVAAPLEWTVEMNPGSVTSEKLAVLVSAGVNRISLGAQSFDDAVLQALGRRHTVADIFQSVDLIRRAGVGNIGLDLIACVPGFDEKVWRNTLEQSVALTPRHLSVYALTDEEGTRLNRAISRGKTALLSDEQQLAALDAAEAVLTAADYHRYEISNYARPGFECRHHCACWRGGEYLGIGPAAASHAGLERWTNRPDLKRYLAALERSRLPPRERDLLTPELKAMERLVFGLRLAEGVGIETTAASEPVLRRLQGDGLVDLRDQRWVLTPRGRQLADYVAVELMVGVDSVQINGG